MFATIEWGGLDTVIVSAGVSALQPVMTLAGVEPGSNDASVPSVDGIRQASAVALKAIGGNYIGPLVSAVTLVSNSLLYGRECVAPQCHPYEGDDAARHLETEN